jgi:hypothetical protein
VELAGVRLVHVLPSGELRIMPLTPTATNRPSPKVTAYKGSTAEAGVSCTVQAAPSVEL